MKYHLFVPSENDSFDLNEVRIKKPYDVGCISIFNITYGKENDQIFVQTPECMLPFGYQLVDSNTINMDLAFCDDAFINIMCDMIKHIQNKLSKSISKRVNDKKFISPVRKNIIRVKNKDFRNVLFYDTDNNPIQRNNINRDDKVIVIFRLEKIILTNDIITVNLELLQLKKNNCIPCKCLFTPRQSQHPTNTPSSESSLSQKDDMPEKYKKMLAMGIPRAAVEHKMKLEGFVPSNSASTGTSTGTSNSTSTPLPSAPRLPSASLLANAALLLKKKQDCPLPTAPPKAKGISTSQKAPSLSEIVNALKNLRSTKSNVS